MSGESAKVKLQAVLVVGLVAGEVMGIKVATCSNLPARAGHMHLHFIGPDPALSYSGVIVLNSWVSEVRLFSVSLKFSAEVVDAGI